MSDDTVENNSERVGNNSSYAMKRWKIIEADADDESALTSRELFKVAVAFKDLTERDPTSLEFYRPTWMKLAPAIDVAIDDMDVDLNASTPGPEATPSF